MVLRVPAFFLFALFCFRQPHLYDGSVIFIHIGARNARPFAVHQRQAAFYIGDADMVTTVVDDRRVVSIASSASFENPFPVSEIQM